MEHGRYTTCDHHDHPHFYMQLTRAKVRPKKNVVTGPAYLVVEDVPCRWLCRSSSSHSPAVTLPVSLCRLIWMTPVVVSVWQKEDITLP